MADAVRDDPASTGQDTATPQKGRDHFIDLLRSASIIRVVGIHILNRSNYWFWPAPTYVMPGMPIVFFVSGGLAYRSLRAVDGVRRASTTYWRRTYRRLLLPYWTFYAVIATVAVIGDVVSDSPRWTIDVGQLFLGATGLVVPDASSIMRKYTGHVWFMSVFLVLAFLAPALVRWFDRSRWTLLATAVALFGTIQWIEVGLEARAVIEEAEAVATFAIPYIAGFWYTDGSLGKVPGKLFAAGAAILAAAAWLYDGTESGTVNASHVMHLTVGVAWLALLLAFTPQLRRLADRHQPLIDRITRRTFTTYLWGWTTCAVAVDISRPLTSSVWGYRVLLTTLSIVLLVIAVLIFGRVEDWSAARPSSSIHQRSRPRRFAS